jgi:hypothetical protein
LFCILVKQDCCRCLTCLSGVRVVHVKLHVFTFSVPSYDVRYDFLVKTVFKLSWLPFDFVLVSCCILLAIVVSVLLRITVSDYPLWYLQTFLAHNIRILSLKIKCIKTGCETDKKYHHWLAFLPVSKYHTSAKIKQWKRLILIKK